MTYYKVKHKLKKLLNDELSNIIVKRKGYFIVYKKYRVTNKNGLWEVLRDDEFIHSFAASSTAISWCLGDKSLLIDVCISLINNDKKLQWKKASILLDKELLKVNYSVNTRNRISYDLSIVRSINNELQETINKTKYIQIKGFIKNATK